MKINLKFNQLNSNIPNHTNFFTTLRHHVCNINLKMKKIMIWNPNDSFKYEILEIKKELIDYFLSFLWLWGCSWCWCWCSFGQRFCCCCSSSSSSHILLVVLSCDRFFKYEYNGLFFDSLQNGHGSFLAFCCCRLRSNFSVNRKKRRMSNRKKRY